MAGFGRPLRAKSWKYRTSHYLRPLRSAGCIFRLDAWKSHDACGSPQVFLQGAIEHRLVTSLIQSQAEQKQLARAIELRFRSGPIGGRSLNNLSPFGDWRRHPMVIQFSYCRGQTKMTGPVSSGAASPQQLPGPQRLYRLDN